jgi:hypothetical protein
MSDTGEPPSDRQIDQSPAAGDHPVHAAQVRTRKTALPVKLAARPSSQSPRLKQINAMIESVIRQAINTEFFNKIAPKRAEINARPIHSFDPFLPCSCDETTVRMSLSEHKVSARNRPLDTNRWRSAHFRRHRCLLLSGAKRTA